MNSKVNIKLTVSYDGTNYCGFQAQENAVETVGGHIKSAVKKITGEDIELICSGRTDKGVHALGQVVNFLTEQHNMNEYNWLRAINSILPKDIRVTHSEKVDLEFSARFSTEAREYRYHIINERFPDALRFRYATYCYFPLDVELLNEYCHYLEGTHDFTSFCSAQDASLSKVRQIYHLSASRSGDMVTFRIVGSAFLHNMVRIIVGTILELARRGLPPERMGEILEGKDRGLAGKTIDPAGLTFQKVYYDKSEVEALITTTNKF